MLPAIETIYFTPVLRTPVLQCTRCAFRGKTFLVFTREEMEEHAAAHNFLEGYA